MTTTKEKNPCLRPLARVFTLLIALGAMGTAGLPGRAAHAQEFPSRVVRLVVPTSAGGSNDFVARLLAKELGKAWAPGVIVENRAGAGGVIGFDAVAKAAPDGHTLSVGSSQFTGSASVYTKLPYDALRDFAPVTLLAFAQWVLVVNPALPVRSVKELIALAKEKPGQINHSSAGTGAGSHLATELLKSMTGANMLHIAYKGTAEAVNDVISGQVQLTITSLVAAKPLASVGKLRVLAVTGKNRSSVVPEIPTIGESVPGYEFNNWFGVLAPRATPNEIVAQLQSNIVRALQAKEVSQLLLSQSIEPVGSSSAQFGDMIRQEITTYTRLVKDIGLRVD
jgi:tripartite-type tricarboxylate transporter receptor subunit TctC